jgi:cytochrome c-type biogenesis protein CcmE
MNRRKANRLIIIAAAGVVLASAAGLSLYAMNSKITLFRTPTDIVQNGLQPGERIRIGGLVKDGSWQRDGTANLFTVTDLTSDVVVRYNGIIPDLFREGQGVVLDGSLSPEGQFVADTVLARHDENYIPAEVEAALKEQGHWKEEGQPYGSKSGEQAQPANGTPGS